MNWKGILGITLSAAAAGLVLGLVIGLRGCGGGNINQLLQENAELKAEVTRQKLIADEADALRADHAERRKAAERALAEVKVRAAASDGKVKELRAKVKEANHERDERDDLIEALDLDRAEKSEQIDLLQTALSAARDEIATGHTVEAALNKALLASESRADKLEQHAMKDRTKKILIGVGSAVGGAGVMALAVYGAGRL